MNRRVILISLYLLLLSFVFISNVFADNDEDSITVNVSVKSVTEIRINPTSLNWTSISPGTAGGQLEIDVLNIGSTNVTGIYGYVDTLTDETANPIGSSSPQSYAAGGVLTLRRNITGAEHYFAGRLEWNYTDWIELSTMPPDVKAWGWFRNTSVEYVWGLANGTDGSCNSTGTVFRVNKYDDVGNSTTRDANSVGNSVAGNLDEPVIDWGLFSFASGPLNGYCVAAYYDCTKLYVYKFDRRNSGTTDFDGCANVAFLNTTMWRGPIELQTVNLNVYMPYGMPSGNLLQGTLTIFAET